MPNPQDEVDLMLRLVSRIQTDISVLSPANRLKLVDALRDSIPRYSTTDHNPNLSSGRANRTGKLRLKLRKKGPKRNPRSAASLALNAVLASSKPMRAGDVLKIVRESRANVPPRNVYAALHAAAEDEKITKVLDDDGKAVYSAPNGGKKK